MSICGIILTCGAMQTISYCVEAGSDGITPPPVLWAAQLLQLESGAAMDIDTGSLKVRLQLGHAVGSG